MITNYGFLIKRKNWPFKKKSPIHGSIRYTVLVSQLFLRHPSYEEWCKQKWISF